MDAADRIRALKVAFLTPPTAGSFAAIREHEESITASSERDFSSGYNDIDDDDVLSRWDVS